MAGDFRIDSTIKRVKTSIHEMENAERTYTALNPVGRPLLSGAGEARDRFAKSKDKCRKEFARLRQELKVGASMDSYPGLIDLGSVGFIGGDDSERHRLGWGILEILVGYYDTQDGDVEPQFYQIEFDQSRVIREHGLLPRELE